MALGIYATLRIFSYFFRPGDPVNTVIATVFFITALYLLIKRNNFGWYLVAAEIILGGSGNYLQINSLSIRTALLVASIPLYIFQNRNFLSLKLKESKIIYLLLFVSVIGTILGLLKSNDPKLLISDIIPYFFILYILPLKHFLREDQKFLSFIKSCLFAAIIGHFIFIAITFTGFSSGYFVLQDSYYHWFRDVANGKITHVSYNFYRLVLNEELLLIPLLIYFLNTIIVQPTKEAYIFSLLLLSTLATNLTRIYMVALVIGFFFLFTRAFWAKWLKTGIFISSAFIMIFCGIFFIGSKGNSFGLEVFGLRLQSIIMPQIEDSSLSRLILLPKILESIKLTTLVGSGFGSVLFVYSPIFKQVIPTPHFDWGYLEILAETGILGLMLWTISIYLIFKQIRNQPYWLIASLASLLVLNVTSPAIFHVFGIIWLTLLTAYPTHVSAPQSGEQSQNP